MSCPEPLFFDTSLNVCNWPEYVDCHAHQEEPSTEDPTTDVPTTYVPTTDVSTTADLTTADHTTEVPSPTTADPTTADPTTDHGTAGTTPSQRCPNGWQEFGSHCYLYGSQWKNWTMAYSDCIMEGGNLASIHSKAENDFVSNQFENTGWIGASDMAEEVIHIT
jgi:hypothetical protein